MRYAAGAECFAADSSCTRHDRRYDIHELEQHDHDDARSETVVAQNPPCIQSARSECDHEQPASQQGSILQRSVCSERGGNEHAQESRPRGEDSDQSQCRPTSRSSKRCDWESHRPADCADEREEQRKGRSHSVHPREELCAMGKSTHRRQECQGSSEAEDLCRVHGRGQDESSECGLREKESLGLWATDQSFTQDSRTSSTSSTGELGDGVGTHSNLREEPIALEQVGGNDASDSQAGLNEEAAEDGTDRPVSHAHEADGVREPERVMSKKARKRLARNVQYLNAADDCHDHGMDIHTHEEIFVVDLNRQGTELCELFSVPRIGLIAEQRGMKCESYDIQSGWDFLKAEDRKRCLQKLRETKPKHLHCCPPCGPFSSMQRVSEKKQNPEERARKLVEAQVLMRFAIQLCEEQAKGKRGFSLEHPVGAKSWDMREWDEFLKRHEKVWIVDFDQCEFGLKDPESGELYRKRTRVITNNEILAKGLDRQCQGNHGHQVLEGKIRVGGSWVCRTECAQIYPKKMCEVFVKSLKRWITPEQHETMVVEELSGRHEKMRESVERCHRNLGHPTQERFLHILRSAGACEEAIKIAKELKCSVCLAKKPPSHHPVVKTTRVEGFNQHVCMDTFEMKIGIRKEKKIKCLNICCAGTKLQIVVPLWKGARAKEVRKAYRKFWLRWAGSPVKVTTDGGHEFEGEMQDGLDRDGTYVHKTAAESPWQNGLCERHGGIWKDIFEKAEEECQPRSKEEYNELIDKVTQSKNSMMRQHGFAPYQHVFGCDLRIPQGLLEGDHNTHYVSGVLQGVGNFQRAHEIRQAARKALVAQDDQERLRKATLRQSRPERGPFEVGDFVYYWRRSRDNKHGIWKGPARVIGFFESKSRIWISHHNKVLRCSPEQLRKLTEDQRAAVQFTTADLLQRVPTSSKRGAQVFTDISAEGRPPNSEQTDMDLGEERESKRQRLGQCQPVRDADMDLDQELAEEFAGGEGQMQTESIESEMDETREPTGIGSGESDQPEVFQRETSWAESPEASQASGCAYGPVRTSGLLSALRRSVDILDHGVTRVPRSQMTMSPQPLQTHPEVDLDTPRAESLMAEISEDCVNFEVFLAQKETQEVKDKDLTPQERKDLKVGIAKEWSKLCNTSSIKNSSGNGS